MPSKEDLEKLAALTTQLEKLKAERDAYIESDYKKELQELTQQIETISANAFKPEKQNPSLESTLNIGNIKQSKTGGKNSFEDLLSIVKNNASHPGNNALGLPAVIKKNSKLSIPNSNKNTKPSSPLNK